MSTEKRQGYPGGEGNSMSGGLSREQAWEMYDQYLAEADRKAADEPAKYLPRPRVRIVSDGMPNNTQVQVLQPGAEEWEEVPNVVRISWEISVHDVARATIEIDDVEIEAEAEMQPEQFTISPFGDGWEYTPEQLADLKDRVGVQVFRADGTRVSISDRMEFPPEPITAVITDGPSDDRPEIEARVRNALAEIGWLLNLPNAHSCADGVVRESLQRAKEHLVPILPKPKEGEDVIE